MSRRLSNCLNYTGSKFRFINIINNMLPQDKGLKFLDLFGGGGDVTANSFYDDVTYNEKNKYVYNFLKIVRDKDYLYNLYFLFDIINQYNLNSSDKDAYDKLKSAFNTCDPISERYYYLFYLLVCHSNSNMIRFNKQGKFNLPFGERTFNKELRAKLRYASEKLHKINPKMLCEDFRDINFNLYDVIYVDPPYLGSDATYNECGAWGLKDDLDLQEKLIEFSANGGKFLLSNQRLCKGVVNNSITDFVDKNQLKMIDLDADYSNCNYQRKDNGGTIEVLVKNY